MSNNELVELQTFYDKTSAVVACTALIGNGIEAKVFSDDEGSMAPNLGILTGSRLMVPASRLDEAQALMKDFQSSDQTSSTDFEQSHIESDVKDTNLTELSKQLNIAWFSAILGLTFFPIFGSIWSLYLLVFRIFPNQRDFKAKEKRKMYFSFTASLTGPLLFALLFASSKN